jgi:hypothetical protein
MPIHKDEMQAETQPRQSAGARDGVGRRTTRDHQARRRQDAVPVRFLDSLVDGKVKPKIVRADDQAPQLAISRLRKN